MKSFENISVIYHNVNEGLWFKIAFAPSSSSQAPSSLLWQDPQQTRWKWPNF